MRRKRIARGIQAAGVESYSPEDQQVIARKVVDEARSFVDSHRVNSRPAIEWSEKFEEDFYGTADEVLTLWEKAGFPRPFISGFEVLSDGSPYEHDGDKVTRFLFTLLGITVDWD